MKYQMSLEGMHCKGCSNLIKMSLEDEGLQEVNINLEAADATFATELDEQKTKAVVEKTFTGLPGYNFKDLKSI